MKHRLLAAFTLALLSVAASLAFSGRTLADEPAPAIDPPAKLSAELERAASKLATPVTLAYKFSPGDEFRTRTVHLATVETKIQGVEEVATSRVASTRLWRIKDVDAAGKIVFENVVEDVDMWNKRTGQAEVRYNSKTDKTPPPGHEVVAASIGQPLSIVTMDQYGRILSRNDLKKQFNPGIGDLTIPFPNQPVKPGNTWSIPEELPITLDTGAIKKVSIRQRYKLDKVEAGVATISVETQILTPVNDPKIQSQLVQRMQRGTIKFDIDAGRLLYKQFDLDEAVFGFSGPDSHMQYLTRSTEEPVKASETVAKTPPAPAATDDVKR
jgi:hypothetical protein